MAEPTEQRVNKGLIIPAEDERLISDPPGVSDASGDHSYDAIEQLRTARFLESVQAEQQSDEPPSGRVLGVSPDTDPGIIESMKLDSWDAAQALESETLADKAADLHNATDALGLDSAPTHAPDDIAPSNYP